PKSLQKRILSIPSNFFFLKLKPNEIVSIAKEADETPHNLFHYTIHNDDHLSIQVIRGLEFNIGYLLGKLSYLDLVQMDIYKLFDGKKYFQIEFNEKVEESDIAYITELLEKLL
ncbi:MAG: hypothetical protein LRY68_06335, partial [Sulfurospirillum sp.]|nr:hypothetical protein [Sulfurospirillum sp.]